MAAYIIHHAIHKARLDCYAFAFYLWQGFSQSINIVSQDSCAFYNDVALYKSFSDIVLEAEEGASIVKALENKNKKAAIHANHGF